VSLRFLAEAADELDAAAAWYEAAEPLLVGDLLAEVGGRLRRLERLPRSAPLVRGVPPRFEARAAGLRRFPFRIVTATLTGERVVVAFAHTSRDPHYWRERLP
jgi:hypothetical protein